MPELARNAFRLHEASSVQLPYLGLALTLLLLGVANFEI